MSSPPVTLNQPSMYDVDNDDDDDDYDIKSH
jgi:hypothetical protein